MRDIGKKKQSERRADFSRSSNAIESGFISVSFCQEDFSDLTFGGDSDTMNKYA